MHKLTMAFNDISDEYITEALEYKKSKASMQKIWILAAALCIFAVFVGATVIGTLNSNGNIADTPQIIVRTGETVTSGYGECEYVSCADSVITLRIKSNTRNHTYCVMIFATKSVWIEPDEPHEEGGYKSEEYVALTNGHSFLWDYLPASELLEIYVDGEQTHKTFIPDDGEFHEVVIDYSALTENGYSVRDTFMANEFGIFYIPHN